MYETQGIEAANGIWAVFAGMQIFIWAVVVIMIISYVENIRKSGQARLGGYYTCLQYCR